jgi:hypothetical protein
MTIAVTLLFVVFGCVLFYVSSGKHQEIGKIIFAVSFFWFLAEISKRTLHLF